MRILLNQRFQFGRSGSNGFLEAIGISLFEETSPTESLFVRPQKVERATARCVIVVRRRRPVVTVRTVGDGRGCSRAADAADSELFTSCTCTDSDFVDFSNKTGFPRD
eukprot:129232_1